MLQEKQRLSSELVQTLQLCHFVPMTDEPKDVRLPFMVTASEAKAIDEWRYRNHIPSRAEAMRLLINHGLLFEQFADASSKLNRILIKMLPAATLSDEDISAINESVKIQAKISIDAFQEIDEILDKQIRELSENLQKPNQG
ncbi:hypothetical protein GJU94_14030 [Brucella sp. 10RB9214]|uniref:hypothetical protein n=1 Tax=unclassified Brucella TaxID=2632610 RepID=UPI000972E780|nr:MULTISPECIES: hypothetical protein [unclassified Brucella]APY14318.1 hypothetical protein BKD02_08620 [Brucella sp. 09RB8910]MRN45474.1 hypothetical protein [Brucella sp. 10RB9212]MRN50932.1 hypothetical protein [Brucella sp. 10RB9214]